MTNVTPEVGQAWVRRRDGRRVEIVVGSWNLWWGRVTLKWLDSGPITTKRIHYLMYEFEPEADASTEDDAS